MYGHKKLTAEGLRKYR